MTQALGDDFKARPYAHRALHDVTKGRPENSRAAILAAVEAGYGIEIDVQLSADDQAMVFHDYALTRLAEGEGSLRDLRADDLQQIRLRGADEGIPNLPEVLDLVRGRVPLVIEIKDQDGQMGPSIGPLEVSVADAVGGYAGALAVMSFNPHSVMRMADLAPEVPRGLVTSSYDPSDWSLPVAVCDHLRGIPDYGRAGCSFVSHEWSDLKRTRIGELKADGAYILCWTIKSRHQEAQARQIADNITFEQYLAPFPA